MPDQSPVGTDTATPAAVTFRRETTTTRLRRELREARAELERLRTGETCVVGMPMSCGDAHTAGHCVRVISQSEREALTEVHRLRTKHNDWTRHA